MSLRKPLVTMSGIASAVLLAAAPAHSATLIVTLDDADNLADNTGYVQVTVNDDTDGSVDFTVDALPALDSLGGANFGLTGFALNVAPGGDAEALDISGLPEGWTASDGARMDGFGRFDILLSGASNPQSSLTFSIAGIDDDESFDYAIKSTGRAPEGHSRFAAEVAGLTAGGGAIVGGNGAVTDVPAVPLPATAWLFGSGALLLLRWRRHRS